MQGHLDEDFVIHTPAKERRLDATTEAASTADAAAAEQTVADDPAAVGQWGPVVDWPVVGVHAALLPNGKVLAYDSVGDRAAETYSDHTFSRATVWNPTTGAQEPVTVTTGFNIFCSGLAHLIDGSIFVAGGNKNSALEGIVQTHVFDPITNTWSLGSNMAAERWYPTVTPLSNGEMLITSGGPTTPEVRVIDGAIRPLSGASLSLPQYPWIDVAPDGSAFYSGPDQTLRSLDTSGNGSWQSYGQRDSLSRDYGGHAMFDTGKILVAGGDSSTRSARVIDLNGATPQVSDTDPMAFGRRQHNLTDLADGTVLATGGNSSGAARVDLSNGVYNAEQWNPSTGTWKTLAAMQVTRQYHSTALLLPDGRVLSAGGGVCGACDSTGYLAKNAEVFSPPYLFKNDGSGQLAQRPVITAAPTAVSYDSQFSISSPDAGSTDKVALVRLGSVTHSVNMEQRYVPLSFSAVGGRITATSPANSSIAPPGVYMLFAIGSDGVPSISKMVRVDPTVPPRPATPAITDTAPESPANETNPEVEGTSDADTTVTIYSTGDCSGTPLASDTAAKFASPGITTPVPANQLTNLHADATDAVGNTSACSAAFPYTEDSSPPETPAIADTAPGSPANETNPEVEGTSDADTTVTIYSTGDCSGTPLASDTAAKFASPGITTPVPANQLTNLHADATDAVGNTSACSAAFPYTEDSSPPETRITAGPKAISRRLDVKFRFASGEPGARFECKFLKSRFHSCHSPVEKTVGPGRYAFKVRAIDASGNTDSSPAKMRFRIRSPSGTAY